MSIEAPRGCSTTSLTSLFPRQVMLGISNNTAAGEKVKEKKKDKKKDFKENTEHRVTDAKQNDGPLMTAGRSALLRSIAAFLKSNDFARTLEVFISETQLELDDIESCKLNLEDILSKFMESRSPDESPINQEDPRDYTAIAEEANKYETTSVAVVSPVDQTPKKSKKKKRKEQEVSSEVALDNLEQKTRCLEPVEKFDESHVLSNTTNKKSKSTAATSNEKEVGADKLRDFVEEKLDELKSAIQDEPVGIKTKERKKKKNKSHEINGITAELEATQKKHDSESDAYTLGNGVADANNEQTLKNTESKSKEKKKRKSKPVSEDLAVEQKDSIYVQHNTHEVTEVKSKDSKKRKKSGSEPEGVSNGENGPENKKQKTEDSDAEKLAQKSGNCVKDNAGKANDSDNKHVLLADNVGDNSSSKKRPEQKGSAEPKTIKAFQRVKVDEVQFVDERLQDNSYWAKGGAEVGYGAKAQEVLGQVRGRDFRHEKTKKKRGSYRGGQIDLGTHSIKFNYSDDE